MTHFHHSPVDIRHLPLVYDDLPLSGYVDTDSNGPEDPDWPWVFVGLLMMLASASLVIYFVLDRIF